ncbi:FAD-dependent oxidoreductase [Roseateles chitinivorans]|uniref:FAD-dependent oxidoreductase n=1 Tax=Roseateles chitinivorans TaxID=2917965 RepID=UPI003D664EC9
MHAPSTAPSDVDYQRVVYPYRRSADQDAHERGQPARHPVVVVGAGPVGLTAAIDLALQGVPVVLLNNDGRLSVGSRALCFAKRTLEILDRLGCGQRLVDKGVSWNVGRVFFRNEQVYQFNLLAEDGHQRPAFVNLQQYYVEGFLVERALELPLVDLRWHHGVTGLVQHDDHVDLEIETPDGPYTLLADHVVACDGSRSTLRKLIGEESHGRTFKDRFLIADVRMNAPFPAERWFWFDPPFHPGQSVLLHRQPDGVWRIDFQLGWEADPELEKQPERILPRVRTLMREASIAAGGDGAVPQIELVWASVYTFACMRMDRFRHGRIVFAGDAAHGVSPFGARGANSGIQDADNLAWKLAAVVHGRAPDALLDTYAREREIAADENILNSTRSTDFITPKSEVSRMFRDATLTLAKDFDFARRLVNSGRLSVPTVQYGMPAADAPITVDGLDDWLLRQMQPGRFTLMVFDEAGEGSRRQRVPVGPEWGLGVQEGSPMPRGEPALGDAESGIDVLLRLHIDDAFDARGLVRQRYGATPGSVVLLRPDQHVCARWRTMPTGDAIQAAMRQALGHGAALEEPAACL